MPATDHWTDRDRAERACSFLRSHGILAAQALPGDPGQLRASLVAAITNRYPAAAGSLVFWTQDADDAFDAAGSLMRPLTLHINGYESSRAIRAAFEKFNFIIVDGPDPLTLTLTP